MIFEESKKRKVINFFFPLHPLKLRECTWAIALLAILISLRIALSYATISIPQFGMGLSLSHTPLIAIGWLFGPIIGFFTGALTDTICYFIKQTSEWFWLYAIQEPMLGFISGIIGSVYLLRANKKDYQIDFIFFQFIFISFWIFCLVFIFYYASPNNTWGKGGIKMDKYYTIYRYIISTVLTVFGIVVEASVVTLYKKRKSQSNNLVIYGTLICFLNSVIFSFILGPISFVELWKFRNNGTLPSGFLKNGYMYYLIARVIKESFRMPLQTIILTATLFIIIPLFEDKINLAKLRWDYPHKRNICKKIIWI